MITILRWALGVVLIGCLFTTTSIAGSSTSGKAGQNDAPVDLGKTNNGTARTNPPALPRQPIAEKRVYKKVAGRELNLFVVKPGDWKASDQRPAAVFFHGGGWSGGKPEQFKGQTHYLATRGMVCASVEYRLAKPKSQAPPTECIADAKSAMRWVRAHAVELGIDPQRIAAGGGSAGGHLAAFTGLVEGLDDPADDLKVSPQPAALLLYNPVFNNGPGKWGYQRVGDRYREFSPAHNITAQAPPTIVFLGSEDRLISEEDVKLFQTEMRKAGVRCDAKFYQGQPHGFYNREPFYTLTLIETDKFLSSLGWLKGPPPLTMPVAAPKK